MTGQILTGRSRAWWITTILAAFTMIAVACGSDEDPTPSGGGSSATNTPASQKLSGTIQIDGSSTVFPITQAVAEEFRADGNNGVQIVVGVSGTGGGMKRFSVGETDISNASRPIKESEAEQAADNGVEFLELRVALDGLSVTVHPDNDFVDCLTTDELNKIWEPGSKVNNWSQVRSGFPDKEIRLYGPGTDSGTFDYFTDEINGEEGATRPDYTPSEDDNVLVQGISGDTGSLGYFGYAYYAENADRLKVVAIDGGTGCIEPTETTINNGTYAPLSRPLFIYVNKASLEKPEVKAFIEYYMENAAVLAAEVQYVALPDNVYQENLQAVRTGEAVMSDKMEEKPQNLSGTIQIDGSSTVFPITQAVAEEFRADGNNGVQIVVGVSGTGGGMKRFTVGETDVSNASRPIKESEAEQAADNGVEFIELRVALDGLSVTVHPDNDFVDCLTTDELSKIWEPGSDVNNWSQVRAGFPDERMRLYGPGTDSGTFDYFTDEINGEEGATRPDYTPSEDDNVLVQGISGDKGSLGYFGYAYYAENTDRLKVVAIDGGDGCVTPTEATINNGTYAPLSRPLFIYVNKASLEKPEVKAFVTYYMENGAQLASEVQYVALPDNVYTENLAAIQ